MYSTSSARMVVRVSLPRLRGAQDEEPAGVAEHLLVAAAVAAAVALARAAVDPSNPPRRDNRRRPRRR